jgi:tetratricopeptide (TPR) repeat protein
LVEFRGNRVNAVAEIHAKWQLTADPARAGGPLGAGYRALLAGDLDTAWAEFHTGLDSEPAACRSALGDLHSTRGDWPAALAAYQQAAAGGDDAVAYLGTAYALAASGAAARALELLAVPAAQLPGDPVLAAYTAFALLRRADEVRSRDRFGRPAIGSRAELAEARPLARRAVAAAGGGARAPEAAELAAAVRAAERWSWLGGLPAAGWSVLFVLAGPVPVLFGALDDRPPVAVAGIAAGAAALVALVLRLRRPGWDPRIRATPRPA